MSDCFTHIVNVAISHTKYFHYSVAAYAWCGDGIVSNHFIAIFLENLSVKNFENRLRFSQSYCHELGVSLFCWDTVYKNLLSSVR